MQGRPSYSKDGQRRISEKNSSGRHERKEKQDPIAGSRASATFKHSWISLLSHLNSTDFERASVGRLKDDPFLSESEEFLESIQEIERLSTDLTTLGHRKHTASNLSELHADIQRKEMARKALTEYPERSRAPSKRQRSQEQASAPDVPSGSGPRLRQQKQQQQQQQQPSPGLTWKSRTTIRNSIADSIRALQSNRSVADERYSELKPKLKTDVRRNSTYYDSEDSIDANVYDINDLEPRSQSEKIKTDRRFAKGSFVDESKSYSTSRISDGRREEHRQSYGSQSWADSNSRGNRSENIRRESTASSSGRKPRQLLEPDELRRLIANIHAKKAQESGAYSNFQQRKQKHDAARSGLFAPTPNLFLSSHLPKGRLRIASGDTARSISAPRDRRTSTGSQTMNRNDRSSLESSVRRQSSAERLVQAKYSRSFNSGANRSTPSSRNTSPFSRPSLTTTSNSRRSSKASLAMTNPSDNVPEDFYRTSPPRRSRNQSRNTSPRTRNSTSERERMESNHESGILSSSGISDLGSTMKPIRVPKKSIDPLASRRSSSVPRTRSDYDALDEQPGNMNGRKEKSAGIRTSKASIVRTVSPSMESSDEMDTMIEEEEEESMSPEPETTDILQQIREKTLRFNQLGIERLSLSRSSSAHQFQQQPEQFHHQQHTNQHRKSNKARTEKGILVTDYDSDDYSNNVTAVDSQSALRFPNRLEPDAFQRLSITSSLLNQSPEMKLLSSTLTSVEHRRSILAMNETNDGFFSDRHLRPTLQRTDVDTNGYPMHTTTTADSDNDSDAVNNSFLYKGYQPPPFEQLKRKLAVATHDDDSDGKQPQLRSQLQPRERKFEYSSLAAERQKLRDLESSRSRVQSEMRYTTSKASTNSDSSMNVSDLSSDSSTS